VESRYERSRGNVESKGVGRRCGSARDGDATLQTWQAHHGYESRRPSGTHEDAPEK
jgi:hypothetical protein